MKITLTYKAEVHCDKTTKLAISQTLKYYERLLAYLIPIIQEEYKNLEPLDAQPRITLMESLLHATKEHPRPKYDFDQQFPRCPCYLRRGAIRDAIGTYESWATNHEAWEIGEQTGGEPQLSYHHCKSPTFYNSNMFKENTHGSLATTKLKLYDGKNWKWFTIALNKHDARYIDDLRRREGKLQCPRIVTKGKKIYLHFPVKYITKLHNEPINNERICAVDLGVNTDATCVIMDAGGTILNRKFVKLSSDKARLFKKIGLIRKAQSNGSRSCRKMWRRVNELNGEIARKTVRAIMDFAIKMSCTSIVCEFLDTSGKIKGSKKQRLALWRKREVYHRLYGQAHVWGMRIHQVCAWNTSRLAYDGSGVVERGKYICDEKGESLGYGYSTVRFSSGKLYNADLNAAMNIGARYFVRSILKAHPAMDESALKAKVLGASGGSTVVLSSLINLRRALELGHLLESVLPVEVWETVSSRAVLGPCL